MKKKLILIVTLAAMLVLAVACSKDNNYTKKETIVIEKTAPDISEIEKDFSKTFTSDNGKISFSYPKEFKVEKTEYGVELLFSDSTVVITVASGEEEFATVEDAMAYLEEIEFKSIENITVDGKKGVVGSWAQEGVWSQRLYIIDLGNAESVVITMGAPARQMEGYMEIFNKMIEGIVFK